MNLYRVTSLALTLALVLQEFTFALLHLCTCIFLSP
ncbi:hypothetical protein EMGBS6_17780 [Opitutia bacterium]|nr:hypothetical protein EMGBS6_17780 [Opitutae bacterium]